MLFLFLEIARSTYEYGEQNKTKQNRPVWRDELTELTGYKLEEVVECGEELWNFYEKMFPAHKVRKRGGEEELKARCTVKLSPLCGKVTVLCEKYVRTSS